MGKPEKRASVIGSIDTNVKLFALIALIVEASLGAALVSFSQEQRLRAFYGCLVLFGVTIAAIVIMEVWKSEARVGGGGLVGSPLTPDSKILRDLVNTAIQTVCRAVSLPKTPEEARLRVFIFRKTNSQLICSHYYSPNPEREMVNELSFKIDARTAEKVAVVRAVIDREICRTNVKPLPENFAGAQGRVSEDLKFVLAAPIFTPDGQVWGTVDFDAGNEIGVALLRTDISDAAMFQLAQHLQIIFGLPEWQHESDRANAAAAGN